MPTPGRGRLQAPASLLALVILWQGAAWLAGSRLLPGPFMVAAAMASEAVHGPLLHDLLVTLRRVAVGFAVSMLLGTGLGLALGRSAALDRWLSPWVIVLLNLPALVSIILAYVWLGLVESAVLLAVALNKVPNVAVTVREGARGLDPDLADVAALNRAGRWRTLRHVALPQLAPYLMAAARNGLALIWKIVLVVEMIGRPDGIGFRLQVWFQLFDVTRVLAYAGAFVLCALAVEAAVFRPLDGIVARGRA